MGDTEIVAMDLGEGRTLLVRVTRAGGGGPTDVGLLEHAAWSDVAEAIHDVGASVWKALARLSPHRASVEFGIDVCARSGKLAALLVEGDARATLKVKLEWEGASPTEAEPAGA